MPRVLITGSRDWENWDAVWEALRDVRKHAGTETVTILHGAARGADAMADYVARQLGFSVLKYPADWAKHGKAAGPIRNQEMLTQGNPDQVIAFHRNGSRGTQDMINRAEAAGLPVRVVEG